MFLTTLFFTFTSSVFHRIAPHLHLHFHLFRVFFFFVGWVMKTSNNYSITSPFTFNAKASARGFVSNFVHHPHLWYHLRMKKRAHTHKHAFVYVYAVCGQNILMPECMYVCVCVWKLQYRNSFIKWFFILLVAITHENFPLKFK